MLAVVACLLYLTHGILSLSKQVFKYSTDGWHTITLTQTQLLRCIAQQWEDEGLAEGSAASLHFPKYLFNNNWSCFLTYRVRIPVVWIGWVSGDLKGNFSHVWNALSGTSWNHLKSPDVGELAGTLLCWHITLYKHSAAFLRVHGCAVCVGEWQWSRPETMMHRHPIITSIRWTVMLNCMRRRGGGGRHSLIFTSSEIPLWCVWVDLPFN